MAKIKILAIGPHPDDIEIGCGGTLLLSKSKKYDINLLVMTKGEHGGNADVREREQHAVGKFLKAKIFWGGLLDTQVKLDKLLIEIIEECISSVKPDIVFIPYLHDTHQDHRNISEAAITASRHLRNVLFYEVPSTTGFNPNTFVDIGPVIKEKMKLLKTHTSQVHKTNVPGLDILENAKSVNIFRGVQSRVKYAEGFLPLRVSLKKFEL